MITLDLPLGSARLLGVVKTILTGAVPDAALIGGLAVTARVASSTAGYRATADIDFVSADDTPPTFVEVLTARHGVEAPIVIDGIKVDVIPTFEVRLATPAALIATKSHAVGFARSHRRATKHASDLLDVYRLVDRYHPAGRRISELHHSPGHLIAVLTAIVRAEYLANPAKAAASMAVAQGSAISANDVAQTMEAFVEDLDDEPQGKA